MLTQRPKPLPVFIQQDASLSQGKQLPQIQDQGTLYGRVTYDILVLIWGLSFSGQGDDTLTSD